MIPAIISRLIIYVYGTLRPAFLTYKALSGGVVEDYKSWSKYWILYALLLCLEALCDVLVYWIPFYEEVKLLTVLCVVGFAPHVSVWAYNSIIAPQLGKRQRCFEEYFTLRPECAQKSVLYLCKLVLAWLTVSVLPVILDLGRIYAYRALYLMFGESTKRWMHDPRVGAEQDINSVGIEDFTENSSETRLSSGAKQMTEEPQRFDEEIYSLLRQTDSTSIYTANDLRRRGLRLSNERLRG